MSDSGHGSEKVLDPQERLQIEKTCQVGQKVGIDHFHCHGCAACPGREHLPAGWWDVVATRRPNDAPERRSPSRYTLCSGCMKRLNQLAAYRERHLDHAHCNGCSACPAPSLDSPRESWWTLSGCGGRAEIPSDLPGPAFVLCLVCIRWFWEIAGESDATLAEIRDEIDDPTEQMIRMVDRAAELAADVSAERRYTFLLQRDPGASRYFRRRGRIRRHRGNFQGALSDFTRAIAIEAKSGSDATPDARFAEAAGTFDRARTYVEMGDFNRASEDLARIPKLYPDFPRYSLLAAYLFLKVGNPERARLCLDFARGQDPDLARDLLQEARRSSICGDRFSANGDPGVARRSWETALLDAELALLIEPGLRKLRLTTGLLLEKLGRRAEAIRALEAELAGDPSQEDVRKLLAELRGGSPEGAPDA